LATAIAGSLLFSPKIELDIRLTDRAQKHLSQAEQPICASLYVTGWSNEGEADIDPDIGLRKEALRCVRTSHHMVFGP